MPGTPSTSPPTASPLPVATHLSRLLVVDEKNMLKLWLEEKLARPELTDGEADEMLAAQEDQGKLWTGPAKDLAGDARLMVRIARDFATWKGARVEFTTSTAGHELVIFKGWPAGRKIITGTRYRVDNPKIVELQIGKPGLWAAARESARFGVYLVVAVDVADYLLRDHSTLGHLLASLTVDVSSVALAAAIGGAAGSFIAGTSVVGLAAFGSLAVGPFLIAFLVGVVAGLALYALDQHFGFTEKLTQLYDEGLARLADLWKALGQRAEERFDQLAHSHLVSDLRQDTGALVERIGREADVVRAEITHAW